MIQSMRRLALRALALVGALFLCANMLVAQDTSDVDVSKWNDVGTRAEVAVDDPDTTDDELEELRGQIVTYRREFDSARGVNATRIANLREQLALLTPETTDGDIVIESQEVVNNRLDLEKQLSALLAPVQVSETAFTRADGLVNEIDAILRERQTDALFEVVESPLNPTNWSPALESLRSSLATLWVTSTPDEAKARAKILRRNLPIIILTTLAGLVLIVRGRFWAKLIVSKLRQAEARGLRIWRFIVSLLRIIFPLIGLALLTHAARTTGYLGERGNEIAILVPVLGGMMLGFRWVADQVFAREEDEALIEMSNKDRSEARFCVSGITFLLIFNLILLQIFEFDEDANLTKTVISFPFTVMISFVVFRLGRLMRHLGTETVDPEDGETTRSGTLVRLVRTLGAATIAVSIAAPLLQAAGYYNASEFLLIPAVLTLVILGLVLALQRFSADVYGTLTGQGGQAREALMPIFFGLFLLILALPVLALIWGARVSNLTEIWSAFRRGFSIGDSQISPTDFLTFALIFTVGYLATRLAQGALKTNVLPKTKIDKGAQNAIVSGLGYVGIFLAGLMAITGAGIDLSSLAIVAGALSVGIGFGLQNIVSNFVSGIILLIERPISEGDWIEVSGGQMGYVRDISVRSTRIETFDRTDVIVPNADLVSGTVTNYTRGNTLGRVIIPVGVAYGTDTKRVEAILTEIAVAHPMTLANPAPSILFVNFGASSLDFEIRMYLRDVNWMMSVKSDVNHAIAKRFVEENIEIPFAQQDVWFRNPEALNARPKTQEPIAPPNSDQSSEPSDAAKGEGDE
jgi:small-conductance mechanosensitive channel